MKTIQHNKKKYNLPEDWQEVTFAQFILITEFIKDKQEDNEELTDEDFYAEVFEIITKLDKSDYLKLSINNVLTFNTTINNLINSKLPEIKFKNIIQILNFVIKVKDINKFNFGEYIDNQHLMSQSNPKNYVKIISNIVDIYKWVKVFGFKWRMIKVEMTPNEKELFINSLPSTETQNILSFFLIFRKMFMANLVHYTSQTVKQARRKRRLQMVGRIIFNLWMPVKKILPKWKKH